MRTAPKIRPALGCYYTTMSNSAGTKLLVRNFADTRALHSAAKQLSEARFFPHEVDDLSIALNFLLTGGEAVAQPDLWPLRYVMLLWLSLICMLPFDLAQFDEPDDVGRTASSMEALAKLYLDKAGIEREGAAILLSRLYSRYDRSTIFYCSSS
jgi:hypothetical protein